MEWLGFRFRRCRESPGVEVTLADRAAERLCQRVRDTVQEPGGYARVRATVFGWVESCGPCTRHVPAGDIVSHVMRATRDMGEDVVGEQEVAERYRRAGDRYLARLGSGVRMNSVGG